MAGELITAERPRIKFETELDPTGATTAAPLSQRDAADADALATLLARAERHHLTPLLNDGLAAGNCAMLTSGPNPRLLVSRSGKRGGERASFVDVVRFERGAWRAVFTRLDDNTTTRPSSDTPLLAAMLFGLDDGSPPLAAGARFLLHGHALAEDDDKDDKSGGVGGGLALARALGAPISETPTLFSTPEDLAEVERLLKEHPYQAGHGGEDHGLYVRRGHGFFLLAEDVPTLERRLARVLRALGGEARAEEEQEKDRAFAIAAINEAVETVFPKNYKLESA
jgi:hypothetical protein